MSLTQITQGLQASLLCLFKFPLSDATLPPHSYSPLTGAEKSTTERKIVDCVETA